MGEMIQFKRPDEKTCPGYLASPKAGSSAPGFVVIQEWWGLNDQIKKTADRLITSDDPIPRVGWCLWGQGAWVFALKRSFPSDTLHRYLRGPPGFLIGSAWLIRVRESLKQ
jgi:hypothetical protein